MIRFTLAFAGCVVCFSGVVDDVYAEGGYGAIAYSTSTQRYGFSHGKRTLNEAGAAAVAYSKSPDAKVVIWGQNRWIAFARDNAGGTAFGSGLGNSAYEAQAKAIVECQKRTSGPCRISVFCYTGPADSVPAVTPSTGNGYYPQPRSPYYPSSPNWPPPNPGWNTAAPPRIWHDGMRTRVSPATPAPNR